MSREGIVAKILEPVQPVIVSYAARLYLREGAGGTTDVEVHQVVLDSALAVNGSGRI